MSSPGEWADDYHAELQNVRDAGNRVGHQGGDVRLSGVHDALRTVGGPTVNQREERDA